MPFVGSTYICDCCPRVHLAPEEIKRPREPFLQSNPWFPAQQYPGLCDVRAAAGRIVLREAQEAQFTLRFRHFQNRLRALQNSELVRIANVYREALIRT